MNKIIKDDLKFIYNSSIIDWKRFENKTILITGAYGMLPSYMAFMLLYLNEINSEFNVSVIAVGRNEEKIKEKFNDYLENPYFSYIICDVSYGIPIDKKIDFIIHGASPADSQYYGKIPVEVLMPNVIGTYNLLELSRKNNIEGFLFFSSGAIYGSNFKENLYENDEGHLDSMELRSCYAESKRMGENMCKSWSFQYNIPAKVVRIAHTFGPTMELEGDNRAVSEFVANVVKGENIIMKSVGNAVRYFCYIADATIGYFKVLLDGENGEAYNVSNKDGAMSIANLAQMLVDMYPKKNLSVVSVVRASDGYLEDKNTIHAKQNTDKLEKLGWKCEYNIRDAFNRTISSFLEE